MASKYLEIIADIKTKLESISKIGHVHDYYRWNNDTKKFIDLFVYKPDGEDQQVRGWEFTRIKAPEHKSGAFSRHHRFKLTGYMALKDSAETDKTFQQLVDDVCEKFRVAESGPIDTWLYLDGDNPDNSPVQAETIDVRTFGGALCHYAEIFLSVTERIVA